MYLRRIGTCLVWRSILALCLIVMTTGSASLLGQTSGPSEEETLIFFLHHLAIPSQTGSSEEHDHAVANRARTLGISVPEFEAAAHIANSYKSREETLRSEALSFANDRAATGKALTSAELQSFSDRRSALARAAFSEMERQLSPENYEKLRFYVLGAYRRTIEVRR